MNAEPKIYVACLAAYNSGFMHGRWIDATESVEDMQDEISAMLAESPVPDAEEWAIHDHEGLGEVGEFSGLEDVARRVEIVEAAETWGIPGEAVLEALFAYGARGTTEDWLADHYVGSADTWEDFAETFTRETRDMDEVPDWAANWIDWERAARDMRLDGDLHAVEHGGTLYFFWNN